MFKRAESSFLPPLLILSFLSVLLVLASQRGMFSPVYKISQTVSSPIKEKLSRTKELLFTPIKSVTLAQDKMDQLLLLEEENVKLSSLVASLLAVKDENEKMRQLLSAPLDPSWKFSPTRVVAENGGYIKITGSSNVKVGMAVATVSSEEQKAGVLVGRVVEVLGNEVKVQTPIHKDSKIAAVTRSKEERGNLASGIVEGLGDRVVLDQVLATEDLQVGDLVLTSGEGNLPPGLLIGQVSEILDSENNVWKSALVRGAASSRIGETLFLVTEY